MRRIIVYLSFVLSALMILSLPLNALDEWTFIPNKLFIQYTPIVQDQELYFDVLNFNGSNYIANIQSELYLDDTLDDPTHKAQSLGIQYQNSHSNSGTFEFEEGMIYTFSGEFYVSSSATEIFDVGFYLANLAYTNNIAIPNMSIYYTVATRAGRKTINWEAVVEATAELTSPEFAQFGYISVEFNGSFEGAIRVQNLTCKAINSYGEKAFYDANIDALKGLKESTESQTLVINDVGESIVESNTEVKQAIENMWDDEYTFVSDKLPDTDTEANGIFENISDILSVNGGIVDTVYSMLTIDEARPCIYLPKVYIPILNIDVWDEGILYFDSLLNNLNPNILTILNPALILIRIIAVLAFMLGGVFKMVRTEYWLNG